MHSALFGCACRICDLVVKLSQSVEVICSYAPMWLSSIGKIFTKPHAIESVSEFDSSIKCDLFRKLDEIGFDVVPFTVNEYGAVGSCGSTLLLVSASGSPFPSTSGVISAFNLCFAAIASPALATISPTFPWCAIFVLVKLANLTFTNVLISFAIEIIGCSPVKFPVYSFSLKTGQMLSPAITFNNRNDLQPHKAKAVCAGILESCRYTVPNGKRYTLSSYIL
jgi:hypothetical protein